jgi:hypothetical protein
MGYNYHPAFASPTAIEYVRKIAVAALLRFRTMHVCECSPTITPDVLNRTVTVSAGATETFSFDELGF